MHVILSSPILVEDGDFNRRTITQTEAAAWVDQNGPVNFSGHQTVKILGVEPAATRRDTVSYDEALIISPRQRLEFGREYTVDEIKAIGVSFVLITKRAKSLGQQLPPRRPATKTEIEAMGSQD
jgi:hypothetical protein